MEFESIDYELSGSKPVDPANYDLRGLGEEDNNQRFVRQSSDFIRKLNERGRVNGN